MRIEVVHAGFFKLDGGAMFGVVPKSIWEKINPPDERNLCTWAMRLLYLEIGSRKILIDTGMGNKQEEKFFKHYEPHGPTLLESLASLQIKPDDITDVLLTHLHFDHAGGAISLKNNQYSLTFPKANYWTSSSQWEWAMHPNDREKASFLKENLIPLLDSGKLILINEEGEWIPGIRLKFCHGHTEGMIIPYIDIGHNTIIYCADLLASVGHIPLPYIMAYDTRPLLSLEEKRILLEEAALLNHILFFEHDPMNECCKVQNTEKGVRLKEVFSLHSILST